MAGTLYAPFMRTITPDSFTFNESVIIVAYKITAFALGAFWAGMAGTLYAPFMRTITPDSFTFNESVIIFAIIVLAGGGNLVGVLVATFIVMGLQDVFVLFGQARLFVFGAALVVVMLVRPHGLFSPRKRRYRARNLIGKFKAGITRQDERGAA